MREFGFIFLFCAAGLHKQMGGIDFFDMAVNGTEIIGSALEVFLRRSDDAPDQKEAGKTRDDGRQGKGHVGLEHGDG